MRRARSSFGGDENVGHDLMNLDDRLGALECWEVLLWHLD